MADKVHLQFLNYVDMRVRAEPGIIHELSDRFTFFAPNYRWHPKYRSRMWDGKIRLLNLNTAIMHMGLAQEVKKFCDERGYELTWDDEFNYENVSRHEVEQFIEKLNLPDWLDRREYQIDSITKCIRSNRRTLLSPTSSGKSMMIYVLHRWYKKKTLLIVPRIGLVKQMASDFESYGFKGKISASTDKDGLDKSNNIDADVVITTWQSLHSGKAKVPKKWYDQFGLVFGDEAHGAKAMSMKAIMSALGKCKYRFGTTGTLDDDPLNEHTIMGLFGPKYKSISTREMMDEGYAAPIEIKCIILDYDEEISKGCKGKKYADEIDYIVNLPERNKFVKNLALSLDNNKLIFFHRIVHGEELKKIIEPDAKGPVFFIAGSVDKEIREEIRGAIEKESDAILLASLGTTSTGISINKLKHMISAHPSKAKITILQAIGRMLRLHPEIKMVYLYDIVDDFSVGKYKNYALKHFEERVKIYDKEQHNYKIYKVPVKRK